MCWNEPLADGSELGMGEVVPPIGGSSTLVLVAWSADDRFSCVYAPNKSSQVGNEDAFEAVGSESRDSDGCSGNLLGADGKSGRNEAAELSEPPVGGCSTLVLVAGSADDEFSRVYAPDELSQAKEADSYAGAKSRRRGSNVYWDEPLVGGSELVVREGVK